MNLSRRDLDRKGCRFEEEAIGRRWMAHKWVESDELAALYVYYYGVEQLPYGLEEIAYSRGIKYGNFKSRIENFRNLDDKGGLEDYDRSTRDVFERYRDYPEPELRKIAFPEL